MKRGSKAKAILGTVVDGARSGSRKAQAARKAKTVAELCDLYLADAEAGRLLTRRKLAKKPSTLATDRGRIERHIKPQLGRMPVGAVDRADIERFMYAVAEGETAARIKTKKRGLARVKGGKGTASRTVGLLGAIFTYAVRHRMRAGQPGARRHRALPMAGACVGCRMRNMRRSGAALRESEAKGDLAGSDSRHPFPCAHGLAQRRGAGARMVGYRP